MNCNVAIIWMHDYLDGELPREDIVTLKAHLLSCPACRGRLEQLQKTDAAAFQSLEAIKPAAEYDKKASEQLTERIMQQLPKQKSEQRSGIVRLIYKYPGVTAAAVFALVMLGSFLTMWEEDAKLIVSGEDLQQIIIEGNTVIVPEGVHLTGNLTVENGVADVKGEIDGNVTVIDGTLNLASTGYIAGQSRTIDRALDWFWYKVTQTFGGSSR
ncbi:zf-HC2 domain-containing protein [Paenibacillus alkaliterrae]|uniref:zf-HC2 domain-containing protein n=1 Tax=Paenibacillus alkaliterrae TaxID=320909 RepID=UPI001F2C8084|nr:zf-HC2 domain-containing protein [Paenibacillus alkaliterrae]MCF2941101.1 zf-HC2 domain-containing protein [Paenibacillus alkaliterrae]